MGIPRIRFYNSPLGDRIADVMYPVTLRLAISYGGSGKVNDIDWTGKPTGWNSALHVPGKGAYKGKLDYYFLDSIKAGDPPTGANVPPYRTTDFSTCFRPDQP
jgi:hypothetical protein